jgi:hypothetical protein
MEVGLGTTGGQTRREKRGSRIYVSGTGIFKGLAQHHVERRKAPMRIDALREAKRYLWCLTV